MADASSRLEASMTQLPQRPRRGLRALGQDRWVAFRNRLIASPGFQRWASGFPLTRRVAHRRARALFDVCAGFVYSQVLFACVRLDLFNMLAKGPLGTAELARRMGLPEEAALRLLRAAASLDLVQPLEADRFALGDLGAAMLGNPGIAAMVEHHSLLYADLADPVALLRGQVDTRLGSYWAYAGEGDPDPSIPARASITKDSVAEYSSLMSASQQLVADDILDAYDFSGCRRLMDVGGGEGGFLLRAAERMPHLAVTLFDLPPVAAKAADRFAKAGLGGRGCAVGGSFLTDDLPTGADVISLIRIVHDHDDASVLKLLTAARKALPAGGSLLIGEPFAGVPGAEPIGDAYFGFYLLAMGQGRARSPSEISELLARAGFRESRTVRTRRPMLTGLIVARV